MFYGPLLIAFQIIFNSSLNNLHSSNCKGTFAKNFQEFNSPPSWTWPKLVLQF